MTNSSDNLPEPKIYLPRLWQKEAGIFSDGHGHALGPQPIEDDDTSITNWWRTICARKWILILATFAGLLASYGITLNQKPLYQGRASLEIEGIAAEGRDVKEALANAPEAGMSEAHLQTQLELLQSRTLIDRVAKRLSLQKLPEFQDRSTLVTLLLTKAGAIPEVEISVDQAVYEHVMRAMTVRQSHQSSIVEILYVSNDPRMSANFVNAVATEFVECQMESRLQMNEMTAGWLRKQLRTLKENMEQSESLLQAYGQESGLLYISGKESASEQRFRELQAELTKAQADRIVKETENEVAAAALSDASIASVDNVPLREFQMKIADLDRQRSEFLVYLTPSNRRLQEIDAQLAALRLAQNQERASVVARIHQSFETAQRREGFLRRAYEDQRRVVMQEGTKSVRYNTLKHEAETNRALYEAVFRRLNEASITSAVRANNIRIVDLASPTSTPINSKPVFNATIGLAGGFLLGLFCIFLQERADHTLRGPGRTPRCPDLGAVPLVKTSAVALGAGGGRSECRNLPEWNAKETVLSDAFRAIAASLLFSNRPTPKVVVISSPEPGEGKTTLACNLAMALTETHRRVLLIDGDLRSPSLHRVFQVENESGMRSLLDPAIVSGRLMLSRLIQVSGTHRGVSLIPAGAGEGNISEILHSTRTAELLSAAREQFDVILIDTPPLLAVPEARVFGKLADGIVLVFRSGKTTREFAEAACQRVMNDSIPLLGTVLNCWQSSAHAYPYKSPSKANA
jgi:succinoglycan biosynthesis transport protein ExoP